MADSNEIIGYDSEADFDRVAAAVRDFETTRRPQAGVKRKKSRQYGMAERVMIVDDGYPVYRPRETRKVALFQMAPDTLQTTIQMFGCDLDGYVLLTVGGATFRIHCQASNAELRAAVQLGRTCRVTAFPGMWEFAWADKSQPIWIEPSDNYYGGFAVIDETQELWRSVTDDNVEPLLVDCIDVIPFIEGEVKRGAISTAVQAGYGVYLASFWRPTAFNFAARS